jgi:IS1 family transposase
MDVVSLPARRCVRLPSVSSGFGPSTVLALKEDLKIGETVRVCGHETQAYIWLSPRDEAWAFCYAKQKNVPTAKAAPEGAGDIWTWVGLDADTKLVASWYVGGRDSEAAMTFMDDLAPRMASRVQLTSDGHRPYLEAIEGAFGGDIDYAMLVKVYGAAPEGQRRYSPAVCTGAHKYRVEGNPDPKHVSTSFVERQNLNIRMGNRRMTRLTNAFSKKAENHAHMMAIYFMHYNFVRIHQTLKVTPAMGAGVSPKLWEMSDMVKVLEDWEALRTAV